MSFALFRERLRWLLLVVVVVSQSAPAGVVLCIGAGNHRAIETVASTRCHPTSTGMRDDGCPKGCQDTPLNEGRAIRSGRAADVTAMTSLPYLAASPASDFFLGSAPFLPAPFRIAPASRGRLRSTVLLI
jgi:hypothetical protein